jgi:hypothetical protein
MARLEIEVCCGVLNMYPPFVIFSTLRPLKDFPTPGMRNFILAWILVLFCPYIHIRSCFGISDSALLYLLTPSSKLHPHWQRQLRDWRASVLSEISASPRLLALMTMNRVLWRSLVDFIQAWNKLWKHGSRLSQTRSI